MPEEKPNKWLHWGRTIALWLLLPVGALITKDVYEYVKSAAASSKMNPATVAEKKPDSEKAPDAPKTKAAGPGARLEQLTRIVPQGRVPSLIIDNMEEKKGSIPLIGAARNGHVKVVEALIQRGADVNARDRESGATAIIAAAQQGHLQVVDLLLKSGADVNARDGAGKTALSEAIRNQHAETVRVLQENGAN